MTQLQRQFLLLALLMGASFHPVFLVAALAYAVLEKPFPIVLTNKWESFDRWGPHLIWLLPVLISMARHPLPPDDALRHVVAYQFGYDYTQVYFGHGFSQTFSWWIGYEVLAGKLAQWVGQQGALHLLQLTGFALVVIPLWLALTRTLSTLTHSRWWAAFILALLLEFLLLPRIIQARPEIWFLGLVLTAAVARPVVWGALAILMAPLYWLSLIYAPAVLLLRTSWPVRIGIGALYSLVCVIFWLWYSDYGWIQSFTMVGTWVNSRADSGFMTMETLPLYAALSNPGVIGLLTLGVVALRVEKLADTDWKTVAPIIVVLAWFTLPNLIRYSPTLMAIYALLLAHVMGRRMAFNPMGRAVPLIGALLVTSLIIVRPLGATQEQAPMFDVPAGARVLASFGTSTFSMTYANPDAVIAPVFEFGAATKPVQDLVISVRKGELDCGLAVQQEVEYLVENTLNNSPDCLKLVAVDGGWRLWQTL